MDSEIKKELPTTSGTDSYLSPISIFKLANTSSTTQNVSANSQIITDPILLSLKELLGEDAFDAYFNDEGDFFNYLPSGTYKINNENTSSNDILKILDQLQKGTISIVNISVD